MIGYILAYVTESIGKVLVWLSGVGLVILAVFSLLPSPRENPRAGLPASVPSAFGTVAISTEKGLVDEDSTFLYGRAFLPQLRIVIREGMSRDFSLYVLDHEVCHIALLEIPLPDDGTEEAVCDAIAKQRAAERR